MTPPSKRRRLFFWAEGEIDQPTDTNILDIHSHGHGFAHTVNEIESEDTAVLQVQAQRHLHQRQAVSVDAVSVQADITVSLDPATVSTSTSSDSVQPSTAIAVNTPATSTAIQTISTAPPAGQTSTPVTTSSIAGYVPSSSKNITVAGDILTGNFTLSTSIHRHTTLLSSGYSNFSTISNATYSPSYSIDPLTSTSEDSTTFVTVTSTYDNGRPSTITSLVGAATPEAPAPTTSTIADNTNANTPAPPPPGTIAGGVVGGAAGLAVLLLVAMLFLRWYRQRTRHSQQALLGPNYSDADSAVSRNGPGMAESAGIRPLLTAVPALFRHQPRSTPAATAGDEFGFVRLSGRKLPSAFSPGMEYGQPPPPLPAAYRDSGASSASPGQNSRGQSPEESTLGRTPSDEQMTVLPGPQRRPTIHNGSASLQVPGAQHARHVSSSARTSGIIN